MGTSTLGNTTVKRMKLPLQQRNYIGPQESSHTKEGDRHAWQRQCKYKGLGVGKVTVGANVSLGVTEGEYSLKIKTLLM